MLPVIEGVSWLWNKVKAGINWVWIAAIIGAVYTFLKSYLESRAVRKSVEQASTDKKELHKKSSHAESEWNKDGEAVDEELKKQ